MTRGRNDRGAVMMLGAAALAAQMIGCEIIASVDRSQIDGGASAGSGGGSSATTSSSASGMGGASSGSGGASTSSATGAGGASSSSTSSTSSAGGASSSSTSSATGAGGASSASTSSATGAGGASSSSTSSATGAGGASSSSTSSATGAGGASSASTSSATGAGGMGAGGMGAGGGADGGACLPTEKLCNGACVAIDDPAFGCGAVGCTPCDATHADIMCTGNACAIKQCNPGFADCDNSASTGCEVDITTPLNCGACANACAAPDQCHTLGACDPQAKSCAYPAKSDGTACNDGNACSQTDMCQSGVCAGSNPKTCAALDQCHVAGSCDPATGNCSNPAAPDGTACDDGNGCTLADTCHSGACMSGSAKVCAALDQCHTAGMCDQATGICSNPVASDGTACDDSDACTQTDACQAGACAGSNPKTCAALDQCHVAGSCDPLSGTCSNPPAANGTACNDSDPCTSGDACQSGVCTGAGCASGVCGASLVAFNGAQTPKWSFNGAAAYDAGTSTAVLMGDAQFNSAGTVIYGDLIAVDAFDVSFEVRMTNTGNGRADGITFMLETDGASAVGAVGSGLGALGLHGFGVEIDLYNNGTCSDANGNHAAIDVLTSACNNNAGVIDSIATSPDLYDNAQPGGGIGDVGDGQWRTVVVHLAGGQMSVSIKGTAVPNLQGVALPGFVAGTPYYFGFSAGSGGLVSRQEIRNVQVSFPSQRCL